MKNIFLDRNIISAIGLFVLLFAINHDTLYFGVSSDVVGITAAIVLFAIGGRPTRFKVPYLLIGLILIFEFISFRLHTKSLHFLSLCLFVCLIFYFFTNRFSFIAFVCVLLFSSVFNKFFEHATTEIKQFLCEMVFHTLKVFLNLSKLEGIHFYRENQKISIDTACMGLSMFKTGLLAAAVLLTIEEKKSTLLYSIAQIFIFCLLVVLLNILSNYFRIILLVLLDCTQENTLHHVVGLCCFIFYQILPMLLLLRLIQPKMQVEIKSKSPFKLLPIFLICIPIIITSLEMKTDFKEDLLCGLETKYDLKNGIWVNDEVFKIASPSRIIYIKTISHKPLICWTGDGYIILNSKKIIINNQEMWFNDMSKNGKLYKSVWWYESKNLKYTSFIEAMFVKLIYNQPIRLINEVSLK